MDFCLTKNDIVQRNKLLKTKNALNKKIKPMVGLSYMNKLDNLKSKKKYKYFKFYKSKFQLFRYKKIL